MVFFIIGQEEASWANSELNNQGSLLPAGSSEGRIPAQLCLIPTDSLLHRKLMREWISSSPWRGKEKSTHHLLSYGISFFCFPMKSGEQWHSFFLHAGLRRGSPHSLNRALVPKSMSKSLKNSLPLILILSPLKDGDINKCAQRGALCQLTISH